MDIAALFLHNMRQGPCPAWGFTEAVDDATKEAIDALFGQYMRYEQDAGFNEWQITPMGDGRFMVRRFTWDRGFWQGTLKEIGIKLAEYYKGDK